MGKRAYFLFFFILSASAADNHQQSKIIPPVTVKAAHHSQRSLTGGPNTVASRQQLAASGAVSVAQALQYLGGVQQQDTTGNGSQVMLGMRGFGVNASSNTLLLVNGIPLTNPDLAPPNLNTIPLHEIEYIEIISGSESVQYGDQAVGGVINLITRDQAREKVALSCGTGSYNMRDCYAALYHGYGRLQYNLSFSHLHTDNYRDHNDYDQNLLMGKFAFPYARGRLHVEFSLGEEDMQYPGALTAAQVRQNREQSSNDMNFFKDWNGSFHLQHRQEFNPVWRLDTHLARRVMQGHGVLYSRFTQSRITDFLKPEVSGKIGEAAVRGGVDIQNDSYRLNSLLGNTEDTQQKYGLFGIADIPVYTRVSLAIGARMAQQNSRLTSLFTNNNINRAWASTLGATYKMTPDTRWYLRRAESFRFPRADENASTPPGSTGLRTQRGAAYETGMEWEHEKNAVQIGLYQLNLRDEITFDPTQTPQNPFGTNRNLSPTTRRGLTLSGKNQIAPKLTLDGQYNYVNARLQTGANAGNRIPLVSETIARAGVNYHFTDHLSAYTEGIFTGNQYPANDDANVAGKIGGYTAYNFHLRYVYNQLTASLRLNNIFNKYYYFYTVYQSDSEFFYPAPGRNFTLTVKYLFG